MAEEIPGHYPQVITAVATTGTQINEDANYVVVTSASANNFGVLPAGYTGMEIRGYVGANGFKLKTITGSATNINTVDTTTTAGAAIPATSEFLAVKNSTTNWIVSSRTQAGAAGATITPA